MRAGTVFPSSTKSWKVWAFNGSCTRRTGLGAGVHVESSSGPLCAAADRARQCGGNPLCKRICRKREAPRGCGNQAREQLRDRRCNGQCPEFDLIWTKPLRSDPPEILSLFIPCGLLPQNILPPCFFRTVAHRNTKTCAVFMIYLFLGAPPHNNGHGISAQYRKAFVATFRLIPFVCSAMA